MQNFTIYACGSRLYLAKNWTLSVAADVVITLKSALNQVLNTDTILYDSQLIILFIKCLKLCHLWT